MNYKLLNKLITGLFSIIAVFIVVGIITGFSYLGYRYNVWKSSCSQVVINGKLEYDGKTNFYQTESRGTATIYKEYEQRFFLPKQTKEIMSADVKIKNTECK